MVTVVGNGYDEPSSNPGQGCLHCIYIYIRVCVYIYMCVCVCVCVHENAHGIMVTVVGNGHDKPNSNHG